MAPPVRGGSLDRRKMNRTLETALDPELLAKAPVLCNKYVLDQLEAKVPKITTTSSAERVSSGAAEVPARRAMSVPRQQHFLEPPREPSPTNSQGSDRLDAKGRGRKRKMTPPHNPSPRIMSPLGFTVHRQKYIEEADSDLEYSFSDGYVPQESRQTNRPVPIWLCVFLVVSYIFAGAFLFSRWEGWHFLDSAYFCFITLTTIGFGDFVPAKRTNVEINIALCSLYLLFGISLLAMSFNLVQEEVITNVKSVAKTLGIIKRDEQEEEDD